MDDWIRDLRFALRSLRKAPGFTAAVVMTLAVGIGANAAIFSVVDAVLVRPLPYEAPERLAVVWETQHQLGLPFMYASPPNYADWREQQTVFEDMTVYRTGPVFLHGPQDLLRLRAAFVSHTLFDVLGIAPLHGRAFDAAEDRPGGDRVGLISDALWRARFGADPDVVGSAITLSEQRYTVIGVMPPKFEFPPAIDLEGSTGHDRSDVWIPLAYDLAGGQRNAHHLTVVARLADGVDFARAEDGMRTIARRLEETWPTSNSGWGVTLVPLEQQVLGGFRGAIFVLFGAVGFVLLIACVNVANLLLARGAQRQKEYAIRTALGAGRARLIRQLLTESVCIALAGGAAGLVLAVLGLRILLRLAPANVPRLDHASIDLRVAGFTLALAVAAGFLFGLAPALQSSTTRLARWLKEGGRSSGAATRPFLRHTLVVSEVALSLVLLVGAGLLFQSFLKLRGVDPGFESANVVTLSVSLPREQYDERNKFPPRFREIAERVRAVPGVADAGFIHDIPLGSDRQGTGFTVEGEAAPEPGQNRQVNFSFVTPGYFDTMGIRVARGRSFGDGDDAAAPDVIVVNESLTRRFFAGGDPLGKQLIVGFSSRPRRVVGVVSDVRHDGLDVEPNPTIYVPYDQVPWSRTLSLVVRGERDVAALVPALRSVIREMEPVAPVYDVRTMDQVLAQSVAEPRFSAFLLGAFAAMAMLLAAVGIYGVISFSVAQGTRDIGLRMALGARQGDVLRMVLGRGLGLTLIGVAIGLVGSLALTRLLAGMLYEIGAADPATFATIAMTLCAVAILACWVPARRAARVDPMVALRDS